MKYKLVKYLTNACVVELDNRKYAIRSGWIIYIYKDRKDPFWWRRDSEAAKIYFSNTWYDNIEDACIDFEDMYDKPIHNKDRVVYP